MIRQSVSTFGVGQRVLLKSFNGTIKAPSVCRSDENYWLLIGQAAEIVAPRNERLRVLVRFNVPVRSFGLQCHNDVENTLLILESDLAADGEP